MATSDGFEGGARSVLLTPAQVSILVVILTTAWLLFRPALAIFSKERELKRAGRPPLPPGTLGLPLIGQTIDFIRHFAKNNLVAYLGGQTAKYGPTFKLGFFGTPTVILGAPAGNKFLLTQDGKVLEQSWPVASQLLLGKSTTVVMTGANHKIARTHLAKFLGPVAVARVLRAVEETALRNLDTHWDPLCGASPVSALSLTKKFAFSVISQLCISLDSGADLQRLDDLFHTWSRGLFAFAVNVPGFAFHKAYKARVGIQNFLQQFIDRRRVDLKEGRATTNQDLLSFFLSEPDEDGNLLPDDYIKDRLLELIYAGYETSSTVLSMAMWFMAMYPDARALLEQEHAAIVGERGDGEELTADDLHAMKYSWWFIQETMRVQSPVIAGLKLASEDFEFNGFTVPKGWKVMWNSQISHVNENFFKDPTKFDPSRFESNLDLVPFSFLPFGGGPRLCPGNEFAKQEILVFIHHLIRRYNWELVDPTLPIVRRVVPVSTDGNRIRISMKK